MRASLSTPAAVLVHGGTAVQSAEALSEGESIPESVVIKKITDLISLKELSPSQLNKY